MTNHKLDLSHTNSKETIQIEPLNSPNQTHFFIAFSGGADSTALLHWFYTQKKLRHIRSVTALHFNHQLHPNANAWAMHCQNLCEQWELPIHLDKCVGSCPLGTSLEDFARQQRYHFFQIYLQQHSEKNSRPILVTAHHQEDQAETFLLQLIRGAGLRGLSAMPVLREFPNYSIWRPFLNLSRQTLLNYVKSLQLSWIQDPANDVLTHARNRIRHEVLPLLEQIHNGSTKTIARSAAHCQEAQHLQENLLSEELTDLQDLQRRLCLQKFAKKSWAQQKAFLRLWLSQAFADKQNCPLPTQKRLAECIRQLLNSKQDAQVQIHWDKFIIRRYQQKAYLCAPLFAFDKTQIIPWNGESPLPLVLEKVFGEFLSFIPPTLQNFSSKIRENLSIRFRQGGERLQSFGAQQSISLKHYLQAQHVEPWLRDRVPLLYYKDQLIQVLLPVISSNSQ